MKKLLSLLLLGLLLAGAGISYAPSAFADDDDEFICYDDNSNGVCDPGEDATASGAGE